MAGLTVSISAIAAPPENRIGFSTTYPTTYADWVNAYPAGNGKMGILVFGNPLDETIIFNDRGFNIAKTNDRSFAQISATDLEAIRIYCANGNYKAANDLAVSAAKYSNGGEGNRHPGFLMKISTPAGGAVSNYSRICNFRTGEISVKWTDSRGNWERKAFVSRRDNVAVQYITPPNGTKLTCSIQLSTDPGMGFPSGWTFTNVSNADYLNLRVAYPSNTGGAGYEGVTRVVVSGGSKATSGNILTVTNADSVMLLTRTERYDNNCATQWGQMLLQSQLVALPADYQSLLAGQIATHQAIYDRVKVDFGASSADRALSNADLLLAQKNSSTISKALLERVFDAGRYYYLSSSSELTPPDLLGLWTGDCNAGFGGFYHLDANLNLQIAQGNIGDMPEAMEGYFHLNEVWQTDFRTNASKLLGCRGMLAGGNSPGLDSGLMASLSDAYPYQYATGEEPWLLYPFWEHYLITGDKAFLQNRLYPLLKDMGNFYEDFLIKTDRNGKYIFAGSVSPENQPAGLGISLVNNSVFDISGAKFALTALVQTCNILGLDQGPGQGVERWSALLGKLPPYLINSDGAFKEWAWPGLNDNYSHRHSSHLLTVWPYREITPETNRAFYDAASVVLSKKDSAGISTGHGILHGALIATGLNNSPSVKTRLLWLLQNDFYYDTLFSSHNQDHDIFCSDTCNALPGILMEMLVGSKPGIIELLPALPADLALGSISGMKTRTRVTVQNLTWDLAARTINCTLKSDLDQDVTLIERTGITSIATAAQVSVSPLGQIGREVHLSAGVSTDFSIAFGSLQPPPNLAFGQPVTVSSTADSSPGPGAVDGIPTTRWASAHTDNEWIYVDLGSVKSIATVKLNWQTASATSYKIQVSNDAAIWTDAYSTTTGNGNIETLRINASGRYVRMLGIKRATTYGYSLWEFEVYGAAPTAQPPAIAPAPPADFTAVADNGRAMLNWSASLGAASYRVKRATSSHGTFVTISNPTAPSYDDRDLKNGATYYYTVSAVNAAGESAASARAAVTPQMPPLPATPTGLAATADNHRVILSWMSAAGARSYTIKRAISSAGPFVAVGSSGMLGYEDTGLTNGATYFYVISAVNDGGESGDSASASATPAAPATGANLALNRPVVASTTSGTNPPALAVDGNPASRWSSSSSDNQWIYVDLGTAYRVTGVTVRWESAYAKAYKIQVSNDAVAWADLYSTTAGTGGVNQLSVSGTGRYVRMLGVTRATTFGFSLWEIEVYGTDIPANLALGQPTTASSTADSTLPSNVVDGSASTRWSSAHTNNEWIYVDLGSAKALTGAKLVWESAFATAYKLQVSNDASIWTDVYSTTTGDGGTDQLSFSSNGRYVRMLGIQRATTFGYSLWEFEIYGAADLPTVSLVATDPTAQKGTSDQGELTISRTGSTASGLSLSLSLSDPDRTVYGTDYSLIPAPQNIAFSAGQTATTVKIAALNPPGFTGALSLTVSLNPSALYSVNGAASSATVKILDSPIHQWKTWQFGDLANQSADAADTADPDGDNESNLEEYALGHLPLDASDEKHPSVTLETVGGVSYLTYRFVRPHPAPTGVSYTVETKANLAQGDWQTATQLPGYPLDLGDGTEAVKYRSNHPADSSLSDYVRLRIGSP